MLIPERESSRGLETSATIYEHLPPQRIIYRALFTDETLTMPGWLDHIILCGTIRRPLMVSGELWTTVIYSALMQFECRE